MKILILLFLCSLSLICRSESISSSNDVDAIVVRFRFNAAVIDSTYKENAAELRRLHTLLTHSSEPLLRKISILACASPEGGIDYNKTLGMRRAKAMRDYLYQQFPSIGDSLVTIHSGGADWEGLRQLALADSSLPARSEVLNHLKGDESDYQRQSALRHLANGVAYRHIQRNYYPLLRNVTTMLISVNDSLLVNQEEQQILKERVLDTIPGDWKEPMEVVTDSVAVFEQDTLSTEAINYRRPLALKTNLLFDAATVLNVELEVPIGKRFSVAGEWMFPWWLNDESQRCLEVLSGNLELRYWWNPRYHKQREELGHHNPLAGWFTGLYAGGGLYDLEWDKVGYQGEFFIAAGVSAGYSLPLSPSLLMEFSLGIGYLQTDYRHYKAKMGVDGDYHLIRQYNGSQTWLGPTKAKVSLTWYPHFKHKKKK